MGDDHGRLPHEHAGVVALELQRRLDLIPGQPPVARLLNVPDIVVSQQLQGDPIGRALGFVDTEIVTLLS